MSRSILMIDNEDSFTFNIVDALERLGATVRTVRNAIAAADALAIARENKSILLLSPGPGRPEDAGCCMELVALAKNEVPVVGVCLGHQAIVLQAGGEVVRAPAPVHGKATLMEHDGQGPFEALSSPCRIGRYHSLGTPSPPDRFHVHAMIDGMAMAISDLQARQIGLQFHPESILTPHGQRILCNALMMFSEASASH